MDYINGFHYIIFKLECYKNLKSKAGSFVVLVQLKTPLAESKVAPIGRLTTLTLTSVLS